MKKTALCILSVAILGSTACSIQTSAIRLAGAESRPQGDPNQVQVFLSEKDIPGEFNKIALIYAEEGFYFGSPSVGMLIDHMKKKAAALGANGLILGGMERQLGVSGGDDDTASLTTDKIMKGLAIYIKK